MCVYIYSIEGSARAPPFASRHRIEPIMALGSDFVVAEPGPRPFWQKVKKVREPKVGVVTWSGFVHVVWYVCPSTQDDVLAGTSD
jgi:hypothetical protein